MDFYYRNRADGTCEVICTRCFFIIGIANGIEAIRGLEDGHHCSKDEMGFPSRRSSAIAYPRGIPLRSPLTSVNVPGGKISSLNAALLMIAAAFVLYALPTVLEFAALSTWNPWIAVVLPGDFLGCMCLIVVFRRVKTGIVLYSLLTALEGCLYSFHMTPPRGIPWIADLVPTLMVFAILLHSPPRVTRYNSIS